MKTSKVATRTCLCGAVTVSFPIDEETGFCNFSLGLLRGNEIFKFHLQVFFDKKPENYSFANQTENMTESEVFARYLAE